MKKIIAMFLALTMIFALCACGGKTEPAPSAEPSVEPSAEPVEPVPGSDLAYVKAQGKLIVGITDFAPMDYRDDNGEWVGFDADMAKAFADSLGVEIEFIEIAWDNKILELESYAIDAVWNGMTLTPDVLSAMSCSKAYCNNAQVVVVKADVADQYQDVESLAGLSFAVEAGSAGEEAAQDAGLDYIAVETQAAALMEVAAGTSDACIIDLLMAGAMIGEGTSYPDMAYTVELTTEEYGAGFRKGSDIAAALDEFFDNAYANGSMMEIATIYGVQESIITR